MLEWATDIDKGSHFFWTGLEITLLWIWFIEFVNRKQRENLALLNSENHIYIHSLLNSDLLF
jgi:hypothetical protein